MKSDRTAAEYTVAGQVLVLCTACGKILLYTIPHAYTQKIYQTLIAALPEKEVAEHVIAVEAQW